MQRESWSPAQNGTTWLWSRWWFFAYRRTSAVESSRGSQAVYSTLHSIACSCVSVSRRKLSSTFVSEDEARSNAHQELQEKDSWRVSDLQAAYCTLLLSCKTLQGEQMSRSFLSQHQAEIASTEFSSKVRFLTSQCQGQKFSQLFSISLGCKNNNSIVVVLLLWTFVCKPCLNRLQPHLFLVKRHLAAPKKKWVLAPLVQRKEWAVWEVHTMRE